MSDKKVLITTVLLLFLSAPTVYGILLFVDKIILCNYTNIIVEGSKDAWIGFAGSIIGGLITMLALYFTISNENEKRESEKSKIIRPFIICKPQFNMEFVESIDKNQNFCHYPIALVVENISNNVVKDLKLESEMVYRFNTETKEYDLDNQQLVETDKTNYGIFTVLLDNIEMIKPNSSFSYQTNFIIDDYETASKISCESFKIIATYKYRDILDIIEYTHHLEYELFINYTNKGDFILFTQNVSNKTIKEEMINKK